MTVLCKDINNEQFNEKFLNVYKCEVLERLHTLKAKNEEYQENLFYKQVVPKIYVGLSDEQALRLAQRPQSQITFYTQNNTSKFGKLSLY